MIKIKQMIKKKRRSMKTKKIATETLELKVQMTKESKGKFCILAQQSHFNIKTQIRL